MSGSWSTYFYAMLNFCSNLLIQIYILGLKCKIVKFVQTIKIYYAVVKKFKIFSHKKKKSFFLFFNLFLMVKPNQ